uniref:F-box domain-containing protein n=1 Tax=Spongospora subterranea TaxID=70186 RepID=A0A0H5R7I8_9EUKA|eukprot:CRZ09722.1 hypothetical protein [Spongospora subterranea]
MPRIVAFSPATAFSKSLLFDNRNEDHQKSPSFKTHQLKWAPSPGEPQFKANKPRNFSRAYNQYDDFEDTFDNANMVGSFRFIQSQKLAISSDRDVAGPCWTHDFYKLPLERIACFLTVPELTEAAMRSCKSWRQGFSQESVWRMIYGRKSYPLQFSQRSFARSWKVLCQGGSKFSMTSLLDMCPESVYFDFTPSESCKFVPSRSNSILGHPRSPIIACLEVLPGFYWVVLQTVVGFIHTGVAVDKGTLIIDRGIEVAAQFLSQMSTAGWKSANVRSITLLLMTLQAVPHTIPASIAMKHPGSFIMQNPFRLVLRFPKGAQPPHYFFGIPSEASKRRIMLLPETLTDVLAFDENIPLFDDDAFATLKFDDRHTQLVWAVRISKN